MTVMYCNRPDIQQNARWDTGAYTQKTHLKIQPQNHPKQSNFSFLFHSYWRFITVKFSNFKPTNRQIFAHLLAADII